MGQYKNLVLDNLDGEEWVDVLGYDGQYEVSNLGRVKSLSREVNTRWGTPRLIKEKILKQTNRIRRGYVDGLIINLGSKTYNVSKVIFTSFYPLVEFGLNECVMHKNKNLLDNRLINLVKTTRKTSKSFDMSKSKRTIKSIPLNLDKAQKSRYEYFNNRTHKECSKCGHVDLVENFGEGISKCRECVNKGVVERRNNYEYQDTIKKCYRCRDDKLDIMFPKNDNICKKCRSELHSEYQKSQKATLGDWYVKNYGKSNYNIKEFDSITIEKLRNEIIEKNKPKHFLDGNEFESTNKLAQYINEKYGIPISTVKRRISDGRTEKECVLNRKEFTLYNKNVSR